MFYRKNCTHPDSPTCRPLKKTPLKMTRLLLDLCLVYMGHRIKVHLQSSPKVGFLCENAINPKLIVSFVGLIIPLFLGIGPSRVDHPIGWARTSATSEQGGVEGRSPGKNLKILIRNSHWFLGSKKIQKLLLWFRNGGHDIYSSQSAKNLSLGF